ncbi:MAG: 3-hydroxyacyl-CoA dehydrogenase NAD-binding domain-containing protein [Thermoanaerobaculales bacterium]|jgi:3-hydroxyacyl-CoA dehydrogenase|nr:3-hydroxyacyl-CoA dehydrogenase NAD-binding domain-containing protein [Thermoanaerobaculales bacterium]
MGREIRKAAVLGAGVMGSGIAAHLANAGISVLMLDIVPPQLGEADRQQGLTEDDPRFRNRFALAGLEGIKKTKPAALYSPRFLPLIEVGNFEDDWQRLGECDWVVEVVVERLDIKQKVFARLEEVRKPGAIVSSNTSGLSIKGMTDGRSDDFKKHFLVTHFFNPVRYMKLLELVAGEETSPEIVSFMADFGRFRLGKGIVFGKDTPNFVGNRIGVYGIVSTLKHMMEMDYQVDEVDAITGPAMGHPGSATFGTSDLVGIDVMAHVIDTIAEGCPDDEERELFKVPDFVKRMIAEGALGRKAKEKGGFTGIRKNPDGSKTKLVLDWKTGERREKESYRYPSLGKAKKTHDVRRRIKDLVDSDDRAGAFAWALLRDTLAYTSRRLGEISDTIVDVDNALKWGFNWALGPFETWDALGVAAVLERMKRDGVEPAAWVTEMVSAGNQSFYVESADGRRYYDPQTRTYVAEPKPSSFLILPQIKMDASRLVVGNRGASLVDIGDGIACIEFHSQLQPKLNPVDADITEVMTKGLEIAERDFRGLVVHHQGENFSAGANLLMILEAVQADQWAPLDEMIRVFQGVTTGLRRASIPVVTAPFGFTFGGGCEITMGGDRVCAAAESYIGLVEVGVGVIPAGGGCLFMLERVLEGVTEPILSQIPFIRIAFENIGMAKVATSGEEARDLKFLRPWDKVEINRDQQLWTAKRMAIGLAEEGYRPPLPRTFNLPGEEGLATLKMMLHNMKLTHWISSHDEKIAIHLGRILTGGDTTINDPVSEQTILDLEREAFLSLCGEPKTQDRIKYMLVNNKPLRN